MQTDTPPSLVPPIARDPDRRFPIRFPGRHDRKLKCWLPNNSPLTGARACAAGMVRNAIYRRRETDVRTRKAQALMRSGGPENERKAAGELVRVRLAREGMRTSALWARVFAHHLENDDPRLEWLALQQSERLRGGYRAWIWSCRWRRVQSIQDKAWNQSATLARTRPLLRRIAAAHDGLEPYGFTLLQFCGPSPGRR